jgi:hypothetical protein
MNAPYLQELERLHSELDAGVEAGKVDPRREVACRLVLQSMEKIRKSLAESATIYLPPTYDLKWPFEPMEILQKIRVVKGDGSLRPLSVGEAMDVLKKYQDVKDPVVSEITPERFEVVSEHGVEEEIARGKTVRALSALKNKFTSGFNEAEQFVLEKFYTPGTKVIRRGWPDFCLVKDGKATFVEVKSEVDTFNEAQSETNTILRDLGFEVKVVVVRKKW